MSRVINEIMKICRESDDEEFYVKRQEALIIINEIISNLQQIETENREFLAQNENAFFRKQLDLRWENVKLMNYLWTHLGRN